MDFGLVRWYLEEMVAGPLKGCRRRLQMRWLRSDLFKRPRYRVTPKFVGGKEGWLEFHVKKTAEFQDPGLPGPCIYVSDGVFHV